MIIYSSADVGDLDELVQLYLKVFSPYYVKLKFKITENQLRDVLYLYLLTDKDGFIVAKEDSKIIGFMIAVTSISKVWQTLFLKQMHKSLLFIFSKRAPLITPPYIYLWNLGHLISEGVDEDYRGKGIAKEMGKRGLNYLKSRNVKQALFETIKGNAPIINLYKCFDFKELREFRSRNIDWVILSKTF